MSAILIISVCVFALIGALAGFFRKFTRTSFWGISVLIALLFERMIGTSFKKNPDNYGLAVILTAVIVLLVISAVLLTLKRLLARAVEARRKLSEYRNFDERAESDELILNAVDSGDRREYKKQLRKKKKIKDSTGVWGILDRIFGTVSGCINALAGVGALIVFLLMFADLSGISALKDAFSSVLNSSGWDGFGKNVSLDLLVICAISFGIHMGYRGGISSAISILVVLGLVGGFGYGAWAIASGEACAGAVSALKNGVLSSLANTLGGTADIIAKAIIAVIIFLLSLVVIILVAIFLPKLIDRFRENKIFSAVDGVLGAIVMCAVVTALLLAFGGIAATLADLPFMAGFNEYAKGACLGDGLYSCNPLASAFKGLPIRGWFKD